MLAKYSTCKSTHKRHGSVEITSKTNSPLTNTQWVCVEKDKIKAYSTCMMHLLDTLEYIISMGNLI